MNVLSNSNQLDSILAARVVRHLSETHQIAFAHLSPEFRVVEYSENFRDILIDPPDIVLDYAIDALLWEFVGAQDSLTEVLYHKTDHFQIDYVIRENMNGINQYFNFIVIPITEQNPSEGLLLVVEDVTERANLERELLQEKNELILAQNLLSETNAELNKINRLKSLFLSMAAHDLRAPLTVILGYVELQRKLLNLEKIEEAETYSAIVVDQIERMDRLIRDFLDLDQIEQGKFRVELKLWDLREIVQNIILTMNYTAQRNKIELTVDLPDKEVWVKVDPERMEQVVYNLVNNAIKYTPSGGKVFVSVREADEKYHCEVKDTGYGMTEEALSKLFQIYYRTQEARESKTEGTGLGLFIVKMIIEAHHGQVHVNSLPGKGSTFTVTLPKLNKGPTTE